jgi:hypothetical protein
VAQIYQTGPDTFRIVDENAIAYADRGRPAPPLPPEWGMTYVSPNDPLKQQAADTINMGPRAREMLYNMPIRVEPLKEGDEYLGTYSPTRGIPHSVLPRPLGQFIPPAITVKKGGYDPARVLAHEAAHAWFYQQMPREQRDEYKLNYRLLPAYDELRGIYNPSAIDQKQLQDFLTSQLMGYAPTEIYATGAEVFGSDMDPNVRDRYYRGFFAEPPSPPSTPPSQKPPPPPSTPPPLADGYVARWAGEQGPPTSYQGQLDAELDNYVRRNTYNVPDLNPTPFRLPGGFVDRAGGQQGPLGSEQYRDTRRFQGLPYEFRRHGMDSFRFQPDMSGLSG